MKAAVEGYAISERRACRLIGQNRNTQRYKVKKLPDEDLIGTRIVELASEYGRYSYRMITAMLRLEGHKINHKRVYRIWRTLGLKVPAKQPKRRRLWLNDGSCVRLRAEHKNHVWSYDFVYARTNKGRAIKILNIIVAPMYILPGSPWENGFVESFSETTANKLLNREIFDTLFEARVLIARWVNTYNSIRPHSTLGYRPPAPCACLITF